MIPLVEQLKSQGTTSPLLAVARIEYPRGVEGCLELRPEQVPRREGSDSVRAGDEGDKGLVVVPRDVEVALYRGVDAVAGGLTLVEGPRG